MNVKNLASVLCVDKDKNIVPRETNRLKLLSQMTCNLENFERVDVHFVGDVALAMVVGDDGQKYKVTVEVMK